MSAPQALVLDLGGVIVAHDNQVLGERLRSRCPAGVTLRQIEAIAGRDAYGTGEASIESLHAELADRLGYAGDRPTFREDWCCHLELDLSMLALVETIAARRRVMIFSNTNDVHWRSQVAASGGRLGRLEAWLSHEIGRLKPDPAAFLHVAEAAGIEPARSVFFDDRLENVEGARAAGFRAELFVDEAGFRRWLADEGVL